MIIKQGHDLLVRILIIFRFYTEFGFESDSEVCTVKIKGRCICGKQINLLIHFIDKGSSFLDILVNRVTVNKRITAYTKRLTKPPK